MFSYLRLSALLVCLALLPLHIHAHVTETASERSFRLAHVARSKRSLMKCGHKFATRSALEHRFSRRNSFIDAHLAATGLPAAIQSRDFIVDGANSSCILTPEGEQGPYYINGSLIRKDIREGQEGVPLLLDIQVTNVNTCEPMTDVMLDLWSANATGVYSDYEPEGTVGLTFLRGLQAVDSNGLAQVITIMPGYYAGRAQHIHVIAHVNYTVLSNSTISGGSVVHTGQLFFDQTTLTSINQIYPYTEDPNSVTLNTADRVVQQQQNTTYYDAFVDVRSLGYNMTSGVIGFINIAIDPDSVPDAAGGDMTGGGNGTIGGNSTMMGNSTIAGGGMPSGAIGGPVPAPSSSR